MPHTLAESLICSDQCCCHTKCHKSQEISDHALLQNPSSALTAAKSKEFHATHACRAPYLHGLLLLPCKVLHKFSFYSHACCTDQLLTFHCCTDQLLTFHCCTNQLLTLTNCCTDQLLTFHCCTKTLLLLPDKVPHMCKCLQASAAQHTSCCCSCCSHTRVLLTTTVIHSQASVLSLQKPVACYRPSKST